MKKKNYIKYILIALITIAVVMSCILVGTLFLNKGGNNGGGSVTDIVSDDKVYSIRSNATDLQKDLYDQLNEAYKNGDMEQTSSLLVQNFVADFFTLSNKTIKNDVGGTQFWVAERRLNLRDKAVNTFYLYFELLCRDYGVSELPEVESIVDSNVKKNDDGKYKVSLSWTYKEKNYSTKDYMTYCEAIVDTTGDLPYIVSFQ